MLFVDEANTLPDDIYGCMDELALNFDSIATADDQSCIYAIQGCTDEQAINFNTLATVDDNFAVILRKLLAQAKLDSIHLKVVVLMKTHLLFIFLTLKSMSFMMKIYSSMQKILFL